MTAVRRHKWSEPQRYAFKTERSCVRPGCTIVKVTRHEPGITPWTEFWRCRDGEVPVRIEGAGTPACEAVEVPA